MNGRQDDPFFEGLQDSDDAELAAALVMALAPIAPPPALRARILDATREGRLHRFADAIAAMIDVTVDKARELLDRIADPSVWQRDLFPGLDAVWVAGGPAVAGCIRGFARLGAGQTFPEHEHRGVERQLVLQGAMIDSSGNVARPGDETRMEAGTRHAYRAADGVDLLLFVVIEHGVDVGEVQLRHQD